MITKLSKKQEAALKPHTKEWLDGVFKYKAAHVDEQIIIDAIQLLYEAAGLKKPEVIVLDSPMALQRKAQELFPQKDGKYIEFSGHINYADLGWVSFYDYFCKYTKVRIEDRLHKNYGVIKACVENVFISIQRKGTCLVSRYPIAIERVDGLLHNPNGPAIVFNDGYSQYYIRGRSIPADLFNRIKSGDFTFDEWNKTESQELRGMVNDIMGSDFPKFLGADMVDETTVVHANGEVETLQLWRTRDEIVFSDKKCKMQWSTYLCPSTGQTFYIPVRPDVETAIIAAKMARGEKVPMDLPYGFNSRS